MIYIFTAMYCEARIFIESYRMKKVQESTRFQQFLNESGDIRLTISGVGEIAAASAVSGVCTQYRPKQADLLLHTGICGGPLEAEGIFLVNKLTEQATGKTFYPDILYRHSFQEAEMVTRMRPWDGCGSNVQKNSADEKVCLYDMEAAAVYQAGAYFFGPHQMVFLKLVSDHGDGDSVSGGQAGQLMYLHKDQILDFLKQLFKMTADTVWQKSSNLPQDEAWLEKICLDMHGTKAMGDLLRQYVHYLKLAGVDDKAAVSRLYEEGILPCRNKTEGKKCFAEIKKRLF